MDPYIGSAPSAVHLTPSVKVAGNEQKPPVLVTSVDSLRPAAEKSEPIPAS